MDDGAGKSASRALHTARRTSKRGGASAVGGGGRVISIDSRLANALQARTINQYFLTSYDADALDEMDETFVKVLLVAAGVPVLDG